MKNTKRLNGAFLPGCGSWTAWACVLMLIAWAAPASGREPVRHVVLITIDALLPEYCLPGERGETVCPNMAELRKEGVVARKALPAYPSLTYPNHASIATGVRVARHGIICNDVFEPGIFLERGAWFAKDLRTPAIWDVLKSAKMKSAALFWPVSAGAKGVKWNLPEFWSSSYGSEYNLVRRYATPGLISGLEEKLGESVYYHLQPVSRRDKLATLAAMEIIGKHKPNLLMLHFLESDKVQHRFGRGTRELDAAMSVIDGYIGQIRDAIEAEGLADRTVMIVLGDHGFATVSRSIGLNALLVREGFITLDEDGEIAEWLALVNPTGNSAGVYFAEGVEEDVQKRVREVIEGFAVDAKGGRRYSIVEAERLRELGVPPDAAFYLEAEPGIMFGGSLNSAFLDRRSTLKGNHGSLPEREEMATGFIVAGPGIRAGEVLDKIELVDVAPTIAALLGLSFPDTDGRVLEEIWP